MSRCRVPHPTEIVNCYIDNTKNHFEGWWGRVLRQRIKGSSAGGFYDVDDPAVLEERLRKCDWEEAQHPDVKEGCQLFKAVLPGYFGLLELSDLPEDVELTCIDPKETGMISIGVPASKAEAKLVSETYLIAGVEEGRWIVDTFHPGPPVSPSTVPVAGYPDGSKVIEAIVGYAHESPISKAEAIRLGFAYAKII
jgi:hypothetical protein